MLEHKVGPFPLCLCFSGNVPSSCFHIDLITQRWRQAWHGLSVAASHSGLYRLLPRPGASAWGVWGCVDASLLWLRKRCSLPQPRPAQLPVTEHGLCVGVRGRVMRAWGPFLSLTGRKRRQPDSQAPGLTSPVHRQGTWSRPIQHFQNFPTPFHISSRNSCRARRKSFS